jgi:hypothetical protein
MSEGQGMNGMQLRDQYIDTLLDRITSVKYPSGELLDRAENLVYRPEQAERLVQYLTERVHASQYPSHQLMDRLERILFDFPGRQPPGS